jgi:hypothetical protein
MSRLSNVATPISVSLLWSCFQLSVSKQTTIIWFASSDTPSSLPSPRLCSSAALEVFEYNAVLSCCISEGGGEGDDEPSRAELEGVASEVDMLSTVSVGYVLALLDHNREIPVDGDTYYRYRQGFGWHRKLMGL